MGNLLMFLDRSRNKVNLYLVRLCTFMVMLRFLNRSLPFDCCKQNWQACGSDFMWNYIFKMISGIWICLSMCKYLYSVLIDLIKSQQIVLLIEIPVINLICLSIWNFNKTDKPLHLANSIILLLFLR